MRKRNIFSFSDSEKMILNCLVVRNRVIDAGSNETNSLSSGNDYMHEVELVRNMAIWALDFAVENLLQKTDQICFMAEPHKWQFRVTLEPGEGTQESERLRCKAKLRGKDTIKTWFKSDSGHHEIMKLDLQILP